MILQIVAIKDRAANAFQQPFFVHTLGQAIRAFSDEVNRTGADNHINRHPDDYDLWHLGEYNDQTGFFDQNHGSDSGEFTIKQIAIGKNLITTRE